MQSLTILVVSRRGADEISLADDSVLERMNSVLDPERVVLLAEKIGQSGTETEIDTAVDNFRFVGTMNPEGDFGQKELIPVHKNRFTEVCHVMHI